MRATYILRIAWKALLTRKTRTLVTVGGIVIGVGAIVFLVSLGYGLQALVTAEVTELDALRLIDVTSEKASILKITDETLQSILGIENVTAAYPLVNIASKITRGSATTDAVAFGTSKEYLTLNAIRPEGRVFAKASGSEGVKEIIANVSLLNVLGFPEGANALGQRFTVQFVLTHAVAPDVENTKTYDSGEYEVVGVLKDASSPFLYVPLTELTALGVKHYSQVTVQTKDDRAVGSVRTALEALGFKTGSIVDTILQINQVFGMFRIVLAAVGAIALIIAALGMFNTLTVSLLERTREIGFMKALGAQNRDVYRIFLTEAIVIASSGGLLGILAGYYLGELVNWMLNVLARTTGNPTVDVFVTPMIFAGGVLFFSFLIGFTTGLFPARRAARINPLDALRYE